MNVLNLDTNADTLGPVLAARGTATSKPAGSKKPAETKADLVLKRLKLAKGASVPSLVEATGWQAHSVRGFLSGTVKKKLGLPLISEVGKDGVRRYRLANVAAPAKSL